MEHDFQEIAVPCPGCQAQMSRVQVVAQDKGPRIELYKCANDECARKAALVYEPGTGLTQDQQTFIEREIARMGAFFPSDYTGSGLGRRG